METETCPYCREPIPAEDWPAHERGVDTRRLACPHQDLEEIADEREQRGNDLVNRIW